MAAARILNLFAGNPTIRPSCSSTNTMRPSVHARTAVGSVACTLSAVVMLMEGVPQKGFVLENQSFDLPQFVRTHTTVACQTDDRLEPELALALRCTDMDMRQFEPFIRVKVKTEASRPQTRTARRSVPTSEVIGLYSRVFALPHDSGYRRRVVVSARCYHVSVQGTKPTGCELGLGDCTCAAPDRRATCKCQCLN